ncbi:MULTISPECIES: winged helix-turn-helix domain-containing protein [Micromonospora]|uniref:GntR family transcriptional regulator n=2 Tax=Micromonospora TaxID=1873 RepID=A0A9X0I4A6_9ACTN|nr:MULTISPECIES: winged helix-turn-helix domain-containing protein [Micromonospora]AEB47342.1 GntR family transcriptional regulator [Micromonospora maris AB-18-032]KUJ46429.1 GntR family transcriptional regulator [Micromonospora maris]MBL6278405.1 winged helix-turn-helix transcriptional regulator [Micromonospora fiedleri]RUL93714.1 GntR family transcriptional regulator [Verrucosispora sp. FIM060022]WSK42649.1 winged helix-turn-helix domain-containing protein [Micromonospora maris]
MSEAAYLQVARDIREQVSSGQLKPGDKLPSFASLCDQYKVSNTVIRAAMLILKAEGLIDGRQGKGVYIANPLP